MFRLGFGHWEEQISNDIVERYANHDKGMMRRAYLKMKGAGVSPDNAAYDDDESYDVAAWGQSFEKGD